MKIQWQEREVRLWHFAEAPIGADEVGYLPHSSYTTWGDTTWLPSGRGQRPH